MKIVIFGLTNGYRHDGGHRSRWRALIQGLAIRGHRIVAVERTGPDGPVPWTIPGGDVLSYSAWDDVAVEAAAQADDAGVALVVAQGPDARLAADLVRNSRAPRRALYDPEAAVSLTALEAGEAVAHLPADGLGGFDMVLASCGGPALDRYRAKAGAESVVPLYPWIVPEADKPGDFKREYLGDLCCIVGGPDGIREGLDRFFLDPAQRLTRRRFVLVGAELPDGVPRASNILSFPDLDPARHADVLASASLALTLARDDERRIGWCPSDRMFLAAACGAAIVADQWEGLDSFFEPGREILVAAQTDDVTTAMMLPRNHLTDLGRRARKRVLAEHSAERRVQELRGFLELRGGGDD
ncbi:glycosyltransferase [Azospirillum sp. YIM B02556]|uniref:Glycosyltransferase n=1 Tax=Azospirillum endophyticum TaxID=2800326 RepID=A0ABS1EZQ2_9PROT|nr:glycosyltransferase [Azospirillum endophyticum]MBK1836640.1 glycosyltransferase [Azospirillum endophyticum]